MFNVLEIAESEPLTREHYESTIRDLRLKVGILERELSELKGQPGLGFCQKSKKTPFNVPNEL